MKKFFRYFLLALATFLIALSFTPSRYEIVSLEEISRDTEYYDGKNVEIITYAQLFMIDATELTVGEVFEKSEIPTHLDLKTNSVDLDSLTKALSVNYTSYNHKRVKVRISGRISDNCNKGIPCCFGRSLTLSAENVWQVGEIEDYSVPEKFRFAEKNGSE